MSSLKAMLLGAGLMLVFQTLAVWIICVLAAASKSKPEPKKKERAP